MVHGSISRSTGNLGLAFLGYLNSSGGRRKLPKLSCNNCPGWFVTGRGKVVSENSTKTLLKPMNNPRLYIYIYIYVRHVIQAMVKYPCVALSNALGGNLCNGCVPFLIAYALVKSSCMAHGHGSLNKNHHNGYELTY